jgi:hypothetical protein
MAIGPVYGNFMYTYIGFRWTADTVACMSFAFAIIYLVLTGCKEAFTKLK